MIKYISLFSGIESAKIAFDLAGIPAEPLAFFEIEKQQSKLLTDKYPNTPNYGDVAKFDFSVFKGKIDFLCGGSPCQSFSMANNKRDFSGIDLMREFIRAVNESEPDYFLFENVPQAQHSFEEFIMCNLFDTEKEYINRLSYSYRNYSNVINSADFGFMQPRTRYYCIGIKNKIGKNPYIKVNQLFDEKIEFDYIPPTEYDLKQFEIHKEKYSNKNVYAYSLCPREISKASLNIPTITRKHPIIKYSNKPIYFYSRQTEKYSKLSKRTAGRIPVLCSAKPILETTESRCAILSAETHEQLQGFPVGYTKDFAFTRRIAMLGNSWHCGTIAEIFKQIFKGE